MYLFLKLCEKIGQDRCMMQRLTDHHVLFGGMGAVTDRTQTVQGRNAPGGGEIAVAATTDSDLA